MGLRMASRARLQAERCSDLLHIKGPGGSTILPALPSGPLASRSAWGRPAWRQSPKRMPPALTLLVAGTAGQANAIALGYGRHLIDRTLAAATINRRLSTLRRLVKLARRLGLVDWTIDIEGMKAQPYRDTAGPGADGWRRLLEAAQAQGDGPQVRRDREMGFTEEAPKR
jgi:hypothetical protein